MAASAGPGKISAAAGPASRAIARARACERVGPWIFGLSRYAPTGTRKGKTVRFRLQGSDGHANGGIPGRTPSVAGGATGPGLDPVETGRRSISCLARGSHSPFVETVMHGRTLDDDSPVRPAECRWHMVFVRESSRARVVFVGPWTTAGIARYREGAEILWVKFALGAFMPHLPAGRFLDTETLLPGASGRSFWLKGSAWPFPDQGNAETFVERLVRGGVLVRDPLVEDVLRGRPQKLSPRTVRHRFLRATVLTRGRVRQIERAQQAAALLRQGGSIPGAIFEAGYFDQPHLTRSLKQWVGHTPAQVVRSSTSG